MVKANFRFEHTLIIGLCCVASAKTRQREQGGIGVGAAAEGPDADRRAAAGRPVRWQVIAEQR